MKHDIRLIAVDLDGTLLTTSKEISAEDRLALAEAAARGIRVVPVTGRNFSFALPAVEPLGAALLRELTLICSNGAVIRAATGETHYRRLLPQMTAAGILAVTRRFRPYTVLMYDHQGRIRLEDIARNGAGKGDGSGELPDPVRPIGTTAWARRNEHRLQYVSNLEESLIADSPPLDPLEILYAGPSGIMAELTAHLVESFPGAAFLDRPAPDGSAPEAFSLLRTEYPHIDFSMLDVIHAECSKGRALAAWSRSQGIAPDEILAIGDNYNDLEMLRYAGLAVVMENAEPELKQQGWPVTRDCNSSGVAHALRRFVL